MEDEERPAKLRKVEHVSEQQHDHDTVHSQERNPRSLTDSISSLPLDKRPVSVGSSSDQSRIEKTAVSNLTDPADELVSSVTARPESPSKVSRNGESVEANKQQNEGDNHVKPPVASAYGAPDNEPIPMSKNQIKKQRRRDEWEAGRDFRKARRKEKTQEKKARKRAARDEEAGDATVATDGQDTSLPQHQGRQNNIPKYRRPTKLPITFVVDCGFDHLMMEKERISLGSQVTRSYSDNYRAPYQAHLIFSSWGGMLKKRFDTVLNKNYENWKGVTFLEEDFVEAAEQAKATMAGPQGGKFAGAFEGLGQPMDTEPGDQASTTQQTPTNGAQPSIEQPAPPEPSELATDPESAQKEPLPPPTLTASNLPTNTNPDDHTHTHQGEIIYLTSDSPNTLTTLQPYSTYIIGGLVDKNRHKGICYKTAVARGIKTAKLPIGEFMEMQSRFVLATNHVVEIMVRWLEYKDWGQAFMKVIPKRKGGRLRGKSQDQDQDQEQDGDGEGNGGVEVGGEEDVRINSSDDDDEEENPDEDNTAGAADISQEQLPGTEH